MDITDAVITADARTINGRKHIEVVYTICSLTMTEASPATLAAWIQGHGVIENKLRWVRDVVFDKAVISFEPGTSPKLWPRYLNTAISLHRLAGHPRIASALRHHSRDSRRPIKLLATA